MTSVWLRQALERETAADEAEPLAGDSRADVCIVGGGYTGLWAAYELKSRAPALDVALIEKTICGAGASGANAGYALSLWVQFQLLEQLFGVHEALRLCRACDHILDELETLGERHGIDIEWRRTGSIWGATCAAQSGHWQPILEALEARQVHRFESLDRDRIAELTGTTGHVAGVLDKSAALLHPGYLVRALRRLVRSMGVRLFEHTPMTRLHRSSPPRVETPRGVITADKVILGLYGWSLALPELARGAMVIFSDAVMTKPVAERLAVLGWGDGPGMTDSRTFVRAYRPTADGRVMWTKAGGAMPYGAGLDRLMSRPRSSLAEMREVLREVFPTLADAPVEGVWTGPIDRSRNGLPCFGRLPGAPDVLFAYGYSGAGLVLSRMGSQMLASLALESRDEWSESPLVSSPKAHFPREPLRYLGAPMVRAAIARKDKLDHLGRTPGPVTRYLLRYKPASYKPS